MATGDFLYLQNQLAILAGRSSAADLDEDLDLCKQVINEALMEVYRPVDGRIPEWARRTVAFQFRAPEAVTLTLTQGSRTVTGYAFPDDFVGSVIQVGSNFYRYAGNAGATSAVLVAGAGTTTVNGVYVPTAYTSGVATTYTAANGSTIVRSYSSSFTWVIKDPSAVAQYQVENLEFGESPVDVAYELVNGAAFAPTVTDSVSYSLVEPFGEATGVYSATLWHVCQPIPSDVSEVLGAPEWLGHGPLSPMTDRETELYYRSNIRGDYHPSAGMGYYGATYGGLTGTAYPSGDPIFYRLETDALMEGAAVTRRFCIIPMPQVVATVSFRANVFPVELVDDADRPKIVGDLVTRCLLPIAREKWGILYKKYTGANQRFLISEADKARAILTLSDKPQKRFSGVARPGLR